MIREAVLFMSLKSLKIRMCNQIHASLGKSKPWVFYLCVILAVLSGVLGVFFSYEKSIAAALVLPKLCMPLLLIFLIDTAMLLLVGAAMGIIWSNCVRAKETLKYKTVILTICMLLFVFIRAPLLFATANCFLLFVACAAVLALSAGAALLCAKIDAFAAKLMLLFAIWSAYLFFVSFGLLILN